MREHIVKRPSRPHCIAKHAYIAHVFVRLFVRIFQRSPAMRNIKLIDAILAIHLALKNGEDISDDTSLMTSTEAEIHLHLRTNTIRINQANIHRRGAKLGAQWRPVPITFAASRFRQQCTCFFF